MNKIDVVLVFEGREIEFDAIIGETVLELCKRTIPEALEGACGGCLACATCHVVIDSECWTDEVSKNISETEYDLLDYAAGARTTSRLGCQVVFTETMKGIKIHIPNQQRLGD